MKTIRNSFLLAFLILSCSQNAMQPLDNSEISNPLPECPESPNCFRASYEFQNEKNDVFSAAQISLENMGTHEITVSNDSSETKIDAVFKIPVFGWLDDVNIEMNSLDSASTYLHIRSASREGYSDLGVNKRRVIRIIKGIQKELNSK